MSELRIVIVGAGPTGLGAAWRLTELGHTEWTLCEASDRPGGLAASVVDRQGFTWDLGCHVLYSHYRYVDALMNRILGDEWIEHSREAWIWMRERWIPYPLQRNLWRLPSAEALRCLDGLLEVRLEPRPRPSIHTFEDWLSVNFGAGLYESFLEPYNRKVWACPPAEMDLGWTRERVPAVDVRRVVQDFVLRRDDGTWGPNAHFRVPLRGGTGAIWRELYRQLPRHRVRLGSRVISVDARRHRITLDSGQQLRYDALISTIPLDQLLARLLGAPELVCYTDRFVHSACHIIGVGFDGTMPPELGDKSWVYFPEPELPFYRVTIFSNYSPHNVPRPGAQWSLLAEVSESTRRSVNAKTVVEDTLAAFRRCGFITDATRVASQWHCYLEYGYPTPWLGRDAVLAAVNHELEKQGIFSRGRFGAWKYEVSNQDHSVMQGVEIVERILRGGTEYTFNGEMRESIQATST